MNLLDAALQAAVVHGADAFEGDFKRWCKINNISRSTAYRHKARIEELGCWQALSNRPKTPAEHATPTRVVDEIVRLRTELAGAGEECGADQVRYYLEMLADLETWPQLGLRVPSRATINKVIKAHGLMRSEPKKRPKSSYRRFVYARPRDCYQIDATEVALSIGAKVVVFEVLDDHSRVLAATLAWDAETAAGAIAAIQRAFDAFGVPALVLSDNGAAFTSRKGKGGTSRFTRHVTKAGARLIHSSPYHPQTCGKVERHHRTFKDWLARQAPPATLEELQGLCDSYQQWYNIHRRHSAYNRPPLRTWEAAPQLGGPTELPLQHDASVHHVATSNTGNITIADIVIGLGKAHSWAHVTVIRDRDHVTVYRADGEPIGHLELDYTKTYQSLRPAA